MAKDKLDLKRTRRYLPQILLVGLGIGTANYIMFEDLNWLQWTIQSLSTSLIIGYILVTVGLNKSWFKLKFTPTWKLYLVITTLFVLAAVLATEAEQIIRSMVFQDLAYTPFSAGKLYLFNAIISLVLGMSFFHYNFPAKQNTEDGLPEEGTTSNDDIINIPVKRGETVQFVPIDDVVYFEAFDNYSFVHTTSGDKVLCDYSLGFMEKRLGANFSRVHRKYIVNEHHIRQIKPHMNGRYIIEFDGALESITSSKGHASIIRKLIKIE